LEPGSTTTLAIDRTAGTATYGNVQGVSNATFGGTLTVTSLGGTFQNGDTFTLFSATNYAGDFAAKNLPALSPGLAWNWTPTTGTLSVVQVAIPPVLSGIVTLRGTSFSMSFSGPSGQGYTVLMTTNLALPLARWTSLTNGTFGASPVGFTDTGATNAARFYCIESP
jgi:hypothetical protein